MSFRLRFREPTTYRERERFIVCILYYYYKGVEKNERNLNILKPSNGTRIRGLPPLKSSNSNRDGVEIPQQKKRNKKRKRGGT